MPGRTDQEAALANYSKALLFVEAVRAPIAAIYAEQHTAAPRVARVIERTGDQCRAEPTAMERRQQIDDALRLLLAGLRPRPLSKS